jgi:large subunit ribosomal protein L24|tara:strand:- start:8084 stop:8440 length:357 start_codon:yes stop_codon:yes gene_type:complete
MISKKPGKQRKAHYNSPLHTRNTLVAAMIDKKLRTKIKKRSIPVRKGDTVQMMRGDFKGHKGKVARVNLKRGRIFVEGITVQKADGSDILYPVHSSNVRIVKLQKKDKKRQISLERLS